MSIWIKRVLAWLLAALATTVLASIFSTQRVLSLLPDPENWIGLSERISMSFYDVSHFGSLYGIFIVIAFLIAFLVGFLVYRFAGFGRAIIFTIAGAVAMLVMLICMKQAFFGVDLVAGARDAFGLSLQMVAGAVGGFVFHKLSRPKSETA